MIQKTKVITLILFGLLFFDLSAQEDGFENDKVANLPDNEKKVRFGLQFSPNLSWFKANTEGYKSEGTKFGFSYGLSLEYFMTKNYLFSSGISVLQTAGNISYKGVFNGLNVQNDLVYVPSDIYVSYKIKYLEIPLVLKLRTNEIGYLTYFGQFGLKAGFNYSAKSDYEYIYGSSVSKIFSNDAKEDINWINLSLVIGVGLEYNISGNTSLSLGLTFNNGFINQLDTKLNELDVNGNALIDNEGNPVLTGKNASANLNYVALNIGIYF